MKIIHIGNKGFAITSIIYGLMLLFVVIISSFLSILVGRNRRMDELVEGVYETLENNEIAVTEEDFDNENNAYITEKKGLYYFDINSETCLTFLPKSTVLVTGKIKEPNNTSVANKLYYKVNGGVNINEYIALASNCIGN